MMAGKCQCGGYIRVRNSHQRGAFQVRYLECGTCRKTHGKVVAPVEAIRQRCI